MRIFLLIISATHLLGCISSTDTTACDPIAAQENLQDFSCMIVNNILLRAKTTDGRDVFIDSEGEAFYNAKSARKPFVASGTGVVLEGGFIGTVAHINPVSFGMSELEQMAAQQVIDTFFFQNLQRQVIEKDIIGFTETNWSQYRVSSFIIPPNSPTIPIQRSIEDSPFSIPPYTYEIDLIYDNSEKDLAIYKASKELPISLSGYSTCDIADEREVKGIENGEAVINWGYQVGLMRVLSQNVTPQPDLIHTVTGLPSSSFDRLQSNIEADHGSSGSFVISKKTGKIIGVISFSDNISNGKNTLCVPANYLRDLYQDALKAQR